MRINLLSGYLLSGGRRIYLTRGQSAIVDDDDYARIACHKWYAGWVQHMKSFYAQRSLLETDKKRVTQRMHREILGLGPRGLRQVDHWNHNTLDNRKKNLRVVNSRGNAENRRVQSIYGPGVQKVGKRFRAFARMDNRQHHIGMFDSIEEARQARADFLGIP